MNESAIIWIGLAIVLIIAFLYKAFVKLRRRKYTKHHIPEMRTRKKRRNFFRRFKYLEGVGD